MTLKSQFISEFRTKTCDVAISALENTTVFYGRQHVVCIFNSLVDLRF